MACLQIVDGTINTIQINVNKMISLPVIILTGRSVIVIVLYPRKYFLQTFNQAVFPYLPHFILYRGSSTNIFFYFFLRKQGVAKIVVCKKMYVH